MNKILDIFRVDIWRKLVALVFAFLLYFNINAEKQTTGEIANVPVAVSVGQDFFVHSGEHRVILSVSGTEENLKKLQTHVPQGRVNISPALENFVAGPHKIRLLPEHFELPVQVKITGIKPGEITVPLQRKICREIPVKVAFTGKPYDGFLLKKYDFSPRTVTVCGPQKAVEALNAIGSEPVSLNWDGDFSKEVKLVNPVPAELELNSSAITVDVKISKSEISRKVFADIPVRFLFAPDRMASAGSVTGMPVPATVKVTVSGSTADIARLTAQDISVFADISAERYQFPGIFRVQLSARLSGLFAGGKVQVLDIVPPVVSVRVGKNAARTDKK